MTINFNNHAIEMTKKFAKAAAKFGSEEYNQLQEARHDYPFLLMLIPLLFSVWQARPVKDSQVYEEPVSTSNVVYNLTVENTVTVVGDVPYYYEVEFVNPETGEPVTGYIYKGNLTEVVPDAPEDVEASEVTPDTAESQRETTE